MDVPYKIADSIVVSVCTDSDSRVGGNHPLHFHTTTQNWHYEAPTEKNTTKTTLNKNIKN